MGTLGTPPPHAQQEAGTSQHPLGFTLLTLHRQVGGGRRRAAQAVAGDTGVFSSIFWLHPENDQRAINQDPHPQLQVTARGEGRKAAGGAWMETAMPGVREQRERQRGMCCKLTS